MNSPSLPKSHKALMMSQHITYALLPIKNRTASTVCSQISQQKRSSKYGLNKENNEEIREENIRLLSKLVEIKRRNKKV